MPRAARIVIPGQAHHVTQRGNNKQNVLMTEQDFSTYCFWINKYSQKYHVDILAYCLMNNHVHLIVVPNAHDSLSLFFRTVHMRYSQYANFSQKRTGHLWQARYFSSVVSQTHLYYAIRYVEQNPVRAKIVKYPWDYSWSSARYHLGKSVSKYIKVKDTTIVNKKYWKEYLMNDDSDIDDMLRQKTYKGKAFACEPFIKYWESRLNCILVERKQGRKRGE